MIFVFISLSCRPPGDIVERGEWGVGGEFWSEWQGQGQHTRCCCGGMDGWVVEGLMGGRRKDGWMDRWMGGGGINECMDGSVMEEGMDGWMDH